MSERDSHFAGFAKALWHELMYVHEAGWIDVSDDGMDEEWIEQYKAIIARRAYDLACHIMKNRFPAYPGVHNIVEAVSDLTELPE